VTYLLKATIWRTDAERLVIGHKITVRKEKAFYHSRVTVFYNHVLCISNRYKN
jgi:hypothetical protein